MNNEHDASIELSARPRPGLMPKPVAKLIRKLLILLPIGVIGNVVYCLATTDRRMLSQAVHVHPGFLACAALLSVVPWFTSSLRLFTWSRFLGNSVSYRDAFKITVSADLGAAIAPPVIGGSAVKVGMLMNRGVNAGTALALPVLENLEDILFFAVMVPLAFMLSPAREMAGLNGLMRFPRASWMMGAGCAALVAVFALLAWYGNRHAWLRTFREKIGSMARAFLETFRLIGCGGKRVLIVTLLLTAAQSICRYSIVSLLFASLGLPVRPVLFMALQVLVFALVTLVPSPGGVGGAELIFSLLYDPFLPPGLRGLITAGWRFFTFYLPTLFAALLVLAMGPTQASGQETAGRTAATNERAGSNLAFIAAPDFPRNRE